MRIWPLLAAIGLVTWREIQSLGSIQANNFFFFVLLLGMQPASIGFLGALLLSLMIVPALGAPLGKVPAIRLALWPIPPLAERLLGAFARPALAAASVWWRARLSLEIRLVVRTLDFWLALLLALCGSLWRAFSPQAPKEAFGVLALLVVLALSTLSQNLFGLDGEGGRTRRKLSPERGWVSLGRKGLVLLGLSVGLTLYLSPAGALAGMLASLAVGHFASVSTPLDSSPWRFSVGRFFPHGFFQVIAMFSCGIAASRGDLLWLALAAGAYLLSLLAFGWIWERS
jgi:hypothetical protein